MKTNLLWILILLKWITTLKSDNFTGPQFLHLCQEGRTVSKNRPSSHIFYGILKQQHR